MPTLKESRCVFVIRCDVCYKVISEGLTESDARASVSPDNANEYKNLYSTKMDHWLCRRCDWQTSTPIETAMAARAEREAQQALEEIPF